MKSIFGVHESALLLRARRMDLLATNLANADTPHYKARDLDFAAALASATDQVPSVTLQATDARHIAPQDEAPPGAVKYRVPYQPSLDGNTVESDLELSRFAENAVAYQASLMFVNGRIATLKAALSGVVR